MSLNQYSIKTIKHYISISQQPLDILSIQHNIILHHFYITHYNMITLQQNNNKTIHSYVTTSQHYTITTLNPYKTETLNHW